MEKPRERAKKYGIESLSDAELVAILLRTGRNGKNVVSVAEEMMRAFENSFLRMEKADVKELSQIAGVGTAKALTIQASLEIGKRMWKESLKLKRRLETPQDVFEFCKDMTLLNVEVVRVMAMDGKLGVIASKDLTVGTATMSLIHPREVFAFAVSYPTSGIILVHNHPSGDPLPSENDKKITQKIEAASKVMGIALLDHIIVAAKGYYSFSEGKAKLQNGNVVVDN
ncbi:RadC family protein [Mesoaciditoga lauensis]|uniref:RadC family protein n=1 Tax=Mesoaciditoga lauensis TaxID=1495039 RepID=UPI00055DFE12|nr:DNA repair protein RadC [Mesoaciditoga lauensis]